MSKSYVSRDPEIILTENMDIAKDIFKITKQRNKLYKKYKNGENSLTPKKKRDITKKLSDKRKMSGELINIFEKKEQEYQKAVEERGYTPV